MEQRFYQFLLFDYFFEIGLLQTGVNIVMSAGNPDKTENLLKRGVSVKNIIFHTAICVCALLGTRLLYAQKQRRK